MTEKAQFQAQFDVSPDEMADLERYTDLLRQWQQVKNLVAPSTLEQLWHRHIADSYQLIRLRSQARSWLDLGSGAGFPGLVVALALKPEQKKRFAHQADDARGKATAALVMLVEANGRKCAFLRAVSRETSAPVQVLQQRIEQINPTQILEPDVITARALAPLPKLFALMAPLMGPKTEALVHKGQDFVRELENASKSWGFAVKEYPSQVDENGVILCVSQLRPR